MQRTPTLTELAAEWRRRAELLTQYGDPNSSRLWRLAAEELDRATAADDERALTLAEAARRTRYSVDHLADLVRRGVLPNAGRKGAPRLRVRDLPAPKPEASAPSAASTTPVRLDMRAIGRRARRG